MSEKTSFRVVIAGGGVAGLTLANALEQADIDYVLLEGRPEIAPQLGASVGLFPHGSRILDQLGAEKRIHDEMAHIKWMTSRDSKGGVICGPDNGDRLTRKRTGYVVPWGDREILLRVLYENLQDKSKVLVNKIIVNIDHRSDGVTVSCADGSSYQGDVLAGADGVFSKTREKIWQLAEAEHPELVKLDRNALTADYNCLFGISTLKCGVASGDMDTMYDRHRCLATIVGQGDKIYYFAEEKLDKTYTLSNIPRYDRAAAEGFVRRNGDMTIRPGLTLADLWRETSSSRLVTTEEGVFKLWTWGRIACLGDSIHKTTPNLGAGANGAIESGAALANALKALVDGCNGRRPTEDEVRLALQGYQKKRELRAELICESSRTVTRLHTLDGPLQRFFVRYLLPYSSDIITEMSSDMIIGATKIDFLPLPLKSLRGARPWNPSMGVGMKESRLRRAAVALPLLSIVFIAAVTMDASNSVPMVLEQMERGKVFVNNSPILLRNSFYHVKSFDFLTSFLNAYFFPAIYGYDPVSRRQLLSFLTDGVVLLNIWLIESLRRANNLTILQFPMLFTFLGQGVGLGLMAPLYYFIHYVVSPIEKFSSTDHRLTRMNWTIATLPAVLGAFLLPLLGAFFWPGLLERQSFLYIWQIYPILLSLYLRVISWFFPDTLDEDKSENPKRDLPVIRLYIGATILLVSCVYISTWVTGPYNILSIFIPTAIPKTTSNLVDFIRDFLRWDQVFVSGSSLLWLVYLFWDLKHAGMAQVSWFRLILSGAITTVGLGPGATLGLGWLWREEIIAEKRHKDALTEESVARLHGVMDSKKTT